MHASRQSQTCNSEPTFREREFGQGHVKALDYGNVPGAFNI